MLMAEHLIEVFRAVFALEGLMHPAASCPIIRKRQGRTKAKNMFLIIRKCRGPAAHRSCRLMLLGSPPDMVRGALSHRTNISA